MSRDELLKFIEDIRSDISELEDTLRMAEDYLNNMINKGRP